MPFSRYLYAKVKEATQDEILLFLNPMEIDFLKSYHVPLRKKEKDSERLLKK